jgi:hypothetical protein
MTAPGATSDEPVATPRSANVSRAGASALWRDMAGGAAADPGFVWALVIGVGLIALGLLGFVPNPIVGSPSAAWGTPLLLTGDAHDVIHLVGGAIAIHAALGMSRPHRDGTLIGLGAAALVLLALGLLDGRWFGVAPYSVGLADQLLHLIVGLGSLVMGLAGSGTVNVPLVTGAYRRASAAAASGGPSTVGAEPTLEVVAPTPSEATEAPQAAEAAAPDDDDQRADDGQPAEAMPEPLGLDLDEPDAAVGPDPELEPAPEPELEPEPEPEPELETEPDPEPAAAPEPAPEPEPEPEPAAEPDVEPAAEPEPATDPGADAGTPAVGSSREDTPADSP